MSAVRRFAVIALALTLCGAVWAGTLTVKAIDGGAPVAGANVEVQPCGMTGNTNADGKWSGAVAAGDQKVIVWSDAGGSLKGGILDITMPAGDHSVSVTLVDAVWIHEVYPLAVGNKWLYEYRQSGRGMRPSRTTWREEVLRSIMMGGEPAIVLEAQKAGTPEWEEIRASTADGFVMYTQEHGPDEIKFDPPMRFGALMPMGYEWETSASAVHSTGAPDTPVTFRAKFIRFADIRMPAGMFRNCAYIEAKFEFGPETNELLLWMAKDIGIVRQIERNTERTNEKRLQEYKIEGVPVRRIMPLHRGPLTPIKP